MKFGSRCSFFLLLLSVLTVGESQSAEAAPLTLQCYTDRLDFNSTNTGTILTPLHSPVGCGARVDYTSDVFESPDKLAVFSRIVACEYFLSSFANCQGVDWGGTINNLKILKTTALPQSEVPVDLRPVAGFPVAFSDKVSKVTVRHVYARLPIEDHFDRATLGTTWSKPTGANGDTIALVSNQLVSSAKTAPSIAFVTGASNIFLNASVEAVVNVVNTNKALRTYTVTAGLIARNIGPADDNLYFGGLVNRTGVYSVDIYKFVKGVPTRIAYVPISAATIDPLLTHIRFTVSSAPTATDARRSILQVFVNGAGPPTATAYDSSLWNPGRVGVRAYGTAKLDDFYSTQNFLVPTVQCSPSGCSGSGGGAIY